jgi:exopolysaccharide biosynthesis predicted pyruvyltransferase EpsI
MNDLNINVMNHLEVSHSILMNGLTQRYQVLRSLIDDRPMHYVDIPVHGNIGDLLIMHGTQAFFRKCNLRPKVTAPAFSYNPEWLDQGDAVVFHGGGNFGDLYAEYGMQALREYVVENKPGNRIIILPQTIHFLSEQAMQRSARIFRKHLDVHFFVRDHASFRLAKRFTDHVYLLPDMAHHLYPILPDVSPSTGGTLLVSRTDSEKRDAPAATLNQVANTTDWPLLLGDRERHIESFRRGLRAMHKLGMGRAGNKLLAGLWMNYSNGLLKKAVTLFSAYENIITDRLHGHILACLMDKPNTVLDNTYGKNSAYVEAWTINSPLVTLKKS